MTKLAFIKHRIAAGVRDEGGVLPALKKAGRLLWDGGFNKLLLGDSYHLTPMEYREWVVDKDSLSADQLARQREQMNAFAEQPKFSIIIPSSANNSIISINRNRSTKIIKIISIASC